ncbi:hypothetical protein J6590_013697 [Homalodisca vitripennis]|nr:hypothetical protein J6590_013697 [Homalodisca vitripennis]
MFQQEIQYNPSCSVTRVPREEALQQFINITTNASNIARETVPHRLNLRYGYRKEQLLDLYGTDLPPGAPIFVYIHGGFWQRLSKDISAYPVIPLREAGIKSAIVGYDLAPNVTLDVIVQEIREMAVFILNIAKEEKTKDVWFGGHSSGAHLAASLLEPDWFNSLEPCLRRMVRGMVLISGIFDVTPLMETSFNENLRLTLETAIRQSPMFKHGDLQLLRSFSVLLSYARQDPPSFHRQSIEYRKVIEKKNPWIRTKLVEIKGETDHFNLVTNLQYPNYELTRDIIGLIKNSQ